MVEVVRNTAQLTPDDRAAIAVYIKSLPPVEGRKPPPKKWNPSGQPAAQAAISRAR